MKIILWGGKELIVTEAQAHQIDEALMDDAPEASDYIRINGLPYKKSSISHFEEGGVTEADVRKVWPEAKRLPSGKICKGQYSINLAVIGLARKQGAKGIKLLTNPQWRAEKKAELYQQRSTWCDGENNSCYCDPDFKANPFQAAQAGLKFDV